MTPPDLDFTAEDAKLRGRQAARDAAQEVDPLGGTGSKSIDEQQEEVRSWLAKAFFWLLAYTVAFATALLALRALSGDQAGLILGPIVTLTTSVTAFYFGSRSTPAKRNR